MVTQVFLFDPSRLEPTPLPIAFSALSSDEASAATLLIIMFPVPVSPITVESCPYSTDSLAFHVPVEATYTTYSLSVTNSVTVFFIPCVALSFKSIASKASIAVPVSVKGGSAPTISTVVRALITRFMGLSTAVTIASYPI